MKANLTKTFVSKLNISILPVVDESGNLIGTIPNTTGKAYVIKDINKKSPPGFELYVGKKVRTFLIQTRVGGKVKRITVGEYGALTLSDDGSDKDARAKAAQIRAQLKTGNDVREAKRDDRRVRDTTLGDIFDNYVTAYKRRPTAKRKANSLKAMDAARNRLNPWLSLSVRAIGTNVVKEIWSEICEKQGHRTAAEQTLMWARASFNHYLDERTSDANLSAGGSQVLVNPFSYASKLSRSRDELEQDYKNKGVRNPIQNTPEGLGAWFKAVWSRKPSRDVAADYLITTLLLGARRNEITRLMWADRVTKTVRDVSSTVDLNTGIVRLVETKNHNTHEVPAGSFLLKLLRERHQKNPDSKYVFPIASESKLAKSEYYSDPRSMIESLSDELDKPYRDTEYAKFMNMKGRKSEKRTKAQEKALLAEFEASYSAYFKFTMHDLRRTFITVGGALEGVPYAVLKRLANHSMNRDITAMYIEHTPEQLRPYMQKIEDALLMHASFGVANVTG